MLKERKDNGVHSHVQEAKKKKDWSMAMQGKSQELNLQYITMRQVILNSQFYHSGDRHSKIFIHHWIEKLDLVLPDLSWKVIRNKYTKLLYLMCQCQTLLGPFASLPTEHELPQLKDYQIREILNNVQSCITHKNNIHQQTEQSNNSRKMSLKSNYSSSSLNTYPSSQVSRIKDSVSNQKNQSFAFWKDIRQNKVREKLSRQNEIYIDEQKENHSQNIIRKRQAKDKSQSNVSQHCKTIMDKIPQEKLTQYCEYYQRLVQGHCSKIKDKTHKAISSPYNEPSFLVYPDQLEDFDENYRHDETQERALVEPIRSMPCFSKTNERNTNDISCITT